MMAIGALRGRSAVAGAKSEDLGELYARRKGGAGEEVERTEGVPCEEFVF